MFWSFVIIVIVIGAACWIYQEFFTEGSWKWLAILALIAIFGCCFLYQREGGKIFGPGGLAGMIDRKEPKVLTGFRIQKYETGIFSNTVTIKNETRSILKDVDVVLTFVREDGTQVPIKKFWSKWGLNELQTIEPPAASYQKMVLKGVAKDDGTECQLESSWTFNRK